MKVTRVVLTTLGMLMASSLASAAGGPTQDELNHADQSTEWLLPNHDYAGVRFVDLKQITPATAASLRPVCIYQGADLNRSQTNPLVYKGTMYITAPQLTVALDPVTCRVKWRHDWKEKAKQGNSSIKNRGAAIKDGKVVRGTQDGYLLALDADSGKVLWEVKAADSERFEAIGMTPLIYDDLVIIGPMGSEYGIKGWIGAFSLSDGHPVWKFNTVPGEGEPGVETWVGVESNMRLGGGIWTTPSLDARQGLLYVPVGNPAPDLIATARAGTNIYTGAMVVLDAHTGQLEWYKQTVPQDTHDWDVPVTAPLFTATIKGARRDVVTLGGKDGLLRIVDRNSREEIYAVPVTTRTNSDVVPTEEGVHTCPGLLGGMEWSAPALDPRRDLMVAPSVDWCGVFKKDEEPRFVAGQLFMGGSFTYDPVEKSRGWLTAIRPSTGEVLWKYSSPRPMLAAVTLTSGGVVLTGEVTGDFLVLDAGNGKPVYRFNVGGPVTGGVVSYAIDGKQYVAVVSGMMGGFWQAQPAALTVVVFALP
ncbi:MAG TPA: PQQ-binding-like beta-propeller repeat protein [Burkholderiales bacterium]|nr:PQQ-binding-like beta-propeller repeat protein [Burkholderiales bacterium]